ncbi:MAG TPA: MFS transporter [Candidatus Acidoferrales bacterium]|nr:MFS transporter [Candidatus Acidoferrales bacterium]
MKYQWVVLSVTTVGIFMAGLDTRIVLIGLPTIAQSLQTDLETLLWVTQGYQIALTIGLLFLGRFTDMFGRVKLYTVGFAIFTVGSGLCVIAPTGQQLIIFRIIQGLGGAVLILNSAALITDSTPAQELGFALGINQIGFTAGAVLGLTVGGILIDTVGWRAIFILNVPIGIFGTLWAHHRLHEVAKREPHSSFDYRGLVLFTSSLTLLLVAISLNTMDAIDTLTSASFYLTCLILFVLFFYYEPRTHEPLLDLSLFKVRIFSAGNISQLLYSLGFGALSLVVILYFQLIRGYSALIAGLLFLPLDVAFIAIGPISGRLSDKHGTRLFATLGMGIGTIGFLASAWLWTATTPLILVEFILVVLGLGLGMFSSPNISSVMGAVPPERRGVASGIRATVFNAGNVISIGLVAYIITTAVPYQIVSGIITGGYTSLTSSDAIGFVTGMERAFIVSAMLTLIGMVASSLRGRELKNIVPV